MIRIKKEASIGELLTGISLTITVIGLFFAWNKEKEIEIQKQAHEIRETYISINSRIDYWQNLNLLGQDAFSGIAPAFMADSPGPSPR